MEITPYLIIYINSFHLLSISKTSKKPLFMAYIILYHFYVIIIVYHFLIEFHEIPYQIKASHFINKALDPI